MKNRKKSCLYFLIIILMCVMSFVFSKHIFISSKKETRQEKINIIQVYQFTNLSEPVPVQNLKIDKDEEDKNTSLIPENLIKFYSNAFLIDEDILLDEIDKCPTDDLNKDKYLIEFLFNLEKEKKDLFILENKFTEPYKKEYLVAALEYFTNIYELDFSIASAIVDVESGFTHKTMLSANNLFGGMSGGRLIRYKTIEYGLLKYVMILKSYKDNNLTTIEQIGYRYNPLMVDGVKVANPNWVLKVNNALNKYQKQNILSLEKLDEFK